MEFEVTWCFRVLIKCLHDPSWTFGSRRYDLAKHSALRVQPLSASPSRPKHADHLTVSIMYKSYLTNYWFGLWGLQIQWVGFCGLHKAWKILQIWWKATLLYQLRLPFIELWEYGCHKGPIKALLLQTKRNVNNYFDFDLYIPLTQIQSNKNHCTLCTLNSMIPFRNTKTSHADDCLERNTVHATNAEVHGRSSRSHLVSALCRLLHRAPWINRTWPLSNAAVQRSDLSTPNHSFPCWYMLISNSKKVNFLSVGTYFALRHLNSWEFWNSRTKLTWMMNRGHDALFAHLRRIRHQWCRNLGADKDSHHLPWLDSSLLTITFYLILPHLSHFGGGLLPFCTNEILGELSIIIHLHPSTVPVPIQLVNTY